VSLCYVDTSALIPFYLSERHSRAADRLLRPAEHRLISRLGVAEFTFAVARRRKLVGHPACLPADDASRVLRQFHEHITTGLFSVVDVGDATYAEAEAISERIAVPLRTLDGLHLALAYRHTAALISFDDNLCAAAAAIGHPYFTYHRDEVTG
jgi:predicted nucleic acid-binding protein